MDLGQPFNAFLSGFSATVGQFVLTGRFSGGLWDEWSRELIDTDERGSFVADPDDRGEQGGFPVCVARAVGYCLSLWTLGEKGWC